MARATYIWVVMDADILLPVGVFTVKHEMKTWLQRNMKQDETKVYRYRDGGNVYAPERVSEIDVPELFS